MPNFTLSEILTIALVILIVFGPQRLPEMAQKAGEWVRKGRSMVTDLRQEFEGEFKEISEPLKDLNKEVLGIKEDMGTSLASVTDDVTKAKKELEDQLAASKKELEQHLEDTNQQIKDLDEATETDEPVDGTEETDAASPDSEDES
ncbi:MAG: hypothetical protein GY926_25090 [bacterium]|nr:hypothetical protein [bacterium]